MLRARRVKQLVAAACATMVVCIIAACGPTQTYIVLDRQGSGNLDQSPSFTVNGPWTLRYSYDCTQPGSTSGLVIQIINASDDTLIAEDPDIIDAKAAPHKKVSADTIINYKATTGTLYLQVQSGCGWRVQVREQQ
ncbi:MAG: hypothetical protein ACYDAC_10090 [Candidatus Dormibacteria bacterium]